MKPIAFLILLIAPEDSTPPYAIDSSPPCPRGIGKLTGPIKAAFWIAVAIALPLLFG